MLILSHEALAQSCKVVVDCGLGNFAGAARCFHAFCEVFSCLGAFPGILQVMRDCPASEHCRQFGYAWVDGIGLPWLDFELDEFWHCKSFLGRWPKFGK